MTACETAATSSWNGVDTTTNTKKPSSLGEGIDRKDSSITDVTRVSITSSGTTVSEQTVAVECGCYPSSTKKRSGKDRGRGRKGRVRRLLQKWKLRKYKDTKVIPELLLVAELHDDDDDDDNLFFFEALDHALDEDDYEASAAVGELFCVPAKESSLAKPPKPSFSKAEMRAPMDLSMDKDPSERFLAIVNTPVEDHLEQLEHPPITLDGDAYPGNLNQAQLEECIKFLSGLPKLEKNNKTGTKEEISFLQQIYSFRDVEDPAFTICRWVRATKFDAEAILKRCHENQSLFERAQQHQFYPDPGAAIGAPFPVYLSQYPFMPIGHAKNGVTVNYFQAGKINPEGILAMTTVQKLEGYFWWSFMHKMKDDLRDVFVQDPDCCRCEGINVIDLQGLNSAALTSETMQVIQLASKVSDFFPETLHRMLILNAPRFFVMAWGVIKQFIDPQTARRIQMFSNQEQGFKALQALVDSDQIPTDYGGTNQSIQEAFIREANDPLLVRQEIDLLHIKRRGGTASLHAKNKDYKGKGGTGGEWIIHEGECMELNCFTRCCSGASVTIQIKNNNNGDENTIVHQVKGDLDNLREDGKPTGKQFTLATNIEGAAGGGTSVSMELQDLDQADKKNSGNSRGYFLLVGDIRKAVPA
jgi:hypothetical protein